MRRIHPALFLIPMLSGCVYAPIDLDLGDLGKTKEVVVIPGDEDQKILLVRVDGEISSDPEGGLFSSGPSSVSRVTADLERASKDPSIKGVVVRINSPGGGVTASDLIYHELLRFGQTRPGTKIVAWFGDVAASGGYYVAQAAERIVAAPTSITGSIGVIAQVAQLHGLAEKVGVEVLAITSGPNKDMGSPFRPMTPEERQLMQELIDGMYGRFVDVVAKGRAAAGLTRERVLELADGRVYTADQALEAKLVDRIGYLEDAVAEVSALAGLTSQPRVIVYQEGGLGKTAAATRYARAGSWGISLQQGDATLEFVRRLVPGPGATFKYLWLPGR